MPKYRSFNRVRSFVLLIGFLMITFLQGCVKEGAIVVNCNPDDESGPFGCIPLSPYTASATGFRSIDGPSPVPASAHASCTASGSWKCATENQRNCSTLYPNKVCKSYYYYTNTNPKGKPAGFCECLCVAP